MKKVYTMKNFPVIFLIVQIWISLLSLEVNGESIDLTGY